jgi:hypothetical protein
MCSESYKDGSMRKYLLIFTICMSVIGAHNNVFSVGVFVTEKNIKEHIENNNSEVIGWSKNGKMAYIHFQPDSDPTGYSRVYIVIIDLVSDRILFNQQIARTEQGIDEKVMPQCIVTLKKNAIYFAPTRIKQFPIHLGSDSIEIDLEKKQTGTREIEVPDGSKFSLETGEVIHSLKYKKTKKKKTVKIVIEGLNRYSVQGYYKSPFENRIAIEYYVESVYFSLMDIVESQRGMIGCYLGSGLK